MAANSLIWLEAHLPELGRIAVFSAQLEDTVIRWSVMLTDPSASRGNLENAEYAKRLHAGLGQNLANLAKAAKRRIGVPYLAPVLTAIEVAENLSRKRNDNLHAKWTGIDFAASSMPATILRSRYKKSAAPNAAVVMDIAEQSPAELRRLAEEIAACSIELQRCLRRAYAADPGIRHWLAGGAPSISPETP